MAMCHRITLNLGLIILLTASLSFIGCLPKTSVSNFNVGKLRLDLYMFKKYPEVASISIAMIKDDQDGTVVRKEVFLADGGLVTIEQIPIGDYLVDIEVHDLNGNVISQNNKCDFSVHIGSGAIESLKLIVYPAEGGLVISRVPEDELSAPEGIITTTIKGKLIGDDEYDLEGFGVFLYGVIDIFEKPLIVDNSGEFEFIDCDFAITDGMSPAAVMLFPDTTKETYYEWEYVPLDVNADTPNMLDLGDIKLGTNASCFEVKVLDHGVPLKYRNVEIWLLDGDYTKTGAHAATNNEGKMWMPIFPSPNAKLKIQVDGREVKVIDGPFLPRTTYKYEIDITASS